MANDKLRLDIITALDNSGLKASKEQLDNLVSQLKTTNNQGKETFYGLEDKLTKVGGKMGDVVGHLGKFGKALGTVGLAVEAFKQGWEVGTWLNDNVITPLFKIKDAEKELIDSNKKLKKEHNDAMASFEARNESIEHSSQQQLKQMEDEIRNLDKVKQSYLNAARAKNEFYSLGMDAEIQDLERKRFEDIATLTMEGNSEGIAQANAAYDLDRKRLEAKKAIAEFDRQTKMMKDEDSTQQQLDIIAQKRNAKLDELSKTRDQLKWLDNNATSAAEYDKGEKKLTRKIERLQGEIDTLDNDWFNLNNDDTFQQKMKNREIQRAILMNQLQTGIGEASLNEDMITQQNGNVLGLNYTQEYIDKLNSEREASNDILSKILEAIRNQTEEMRME